MIFNPDTWAPINEPKAKEEVVHSPKHYTKGGIETIDYIKAKLGPAGFKAYCLGNVLKYISRHEFKNGKEDLMKAAKYLEWAIEATGVE